MGEVVRRYDFAAPNDEAALETATISNTATLR